MQVIKKEHFFQKEYALKFLSLLRVFRRKNEKISSLFYFLLNIVLISNSDNVERTVIFLESIAPHYLPDTGSMTHGSNCFINKLKKNL